MKFEKEFRKDHPETIGEKEHCFDLLNYSEWLENKIEEFCLCEVIFSKDKTCRIFGSEISFSKEVIFDDVNVVCKDIFENPDKYSDYKKDSESAYYNFIKYLWVEYPDGSEKRLVDVVDN